MEIKTKKCSKCKVEKDISLFHKRGEDHNKFRSHCKDCMSKSAINLKNKNKKPKKETVAKTSKVCTKCKIDKIFTEYNKRTSSKDGFRSQCKICEKEYTVINFDKIKESDKKRYNKNKEKIYLRNRKWVLQNNDKIKEYFKKYYSDNNDIILKRSREYRLHNSEKVKQYRKEYYNKNKKEILESQREYNKSRKEYNKLKSYEWRKNNRERWIETRSKRQAERRINDIAFKLKGNIVSRMNLALKGKIKSARTEKLLGCTIAELRIYLENKFKEGMSWENRSEWHIDHIKPCALFDLSKEKEQKKCFHYTNLQPLWARENILKKDKYEHAYV